MPFSGTSAHERRKAAYVANKAGPGINSSDSTVPNHSSGAAEDQQPLKSRSPTSIHTLVSATLKLSRKTKIPSTRKAYRGLGRMQLGPEWFSPDPRGSRSGVELGFMSTTLRRDVALEYSGVKIRGVGTILEFDVGSIDCGAQLGSLSQYPGLKCEYSTIKRTMISHAKINLNLMLMLPT